MMNEHHRPHGAHPSRSRAAAVANLAAGQRPANILDPESDEVRELLEQLDDVIYTAIRGCTDALDSARTLWPQTMAKLGWRVVEESREEYLRYAINVSQKLDQSTTRTPERMSAALEIISLLMKE